MRAKTKKKIDRRGIPFTEKEIARAIRLYKDGWGLRDVGVSIGRSHWGVANVLRAHGCEIRPWGMRRRFNAEEIKAICGAYKKGVPIYHLHCYYRTDHRTIRKILVDHGIRIRSSGEQSAEIKRRKRAGDVPIV